MIYPHIRLQPNISFVVKAGENKPFERKIMHLKVN